MNVNDILAQLTAERNRLNDAIAALSTFSTSGAPRRGRPKKSTQIKKKRQMSAEGRARIAAAQKARWAATKKAQKS